MDRKGWKTLCPSLLLLGTFIGSFALTSLFAYIAFTGGSSLPDADTQNLYLLGLLCSFGLLTVYLWWTSYAQEVAWKGRTLRVRNVFGREQIREFTEISSVKKSEFRGDFRIRFRNGSAVIFSIYMHGAQELIGKLPAPKR